MYLFLKKHIVYQIYFCYDLHAFRLTFYCNYLIVMDYVIVHWFIYRPSDDVNGTLMTCNKDCVCDNVPYSPVCDSQGVSYYSPCHAACTKQTTKGEVNILHINYKEWYENENYCCRLCLKIRIPRVFLLPISSAVLKTPIGK